MSGLEFVGCFENRIFSISVSQFKFNLKIHNSSAMVNGTVLSIEESVTSLDRVAFISAVEKLQT